MKQRAAVLLHPLHRHGPHPRHGRSRLPALRRKVRQRESRMRLRRVNKEDMYLHIMVTEGQRIFKFNLRFHHAVWYVFLNCFLFSFFPCFNSYNFSYLMCFSFIISWAYCLVHKNKELNVKENSI